MPLFRRKPPRLPLRMPRMDGSSWPDPRDVERRSFAALTLYEMGYREAFEAEAATIADRLVDEVLPMFAIDSAPEDAPYLRQVFVSAAQIGAGIGIVDRRTAHPESGASTERSGGPVGSRQRTPGDACGAATHRVLPASGRALRRANRSRDDPSVAGLPG